MTNNNKGPLLIYRKGYHEDKTDHKCIAAFKSGNFQPFPNKVKIILLRHRLYILAIKECTKTGFD